MAFRIGGKFRYEIWTPDQTILSASPWSNNGIITATIDHLFNVYFTNGTPPAAWYLGLISNTGFTALSASDSMSSHAGWTEATNYSNATRPVWNPGDSSGGVKTNSAAASFLIDTEEAIRGMFVVSDSTKGGSSGRLWATGTFSTGATTPPVGTTFRLFYELEGREG